MTTHKDGLLRVFWPSDAPRHEIPGTLVGWRNSDLDVLVVSVLQGVEARNVDHALRMRQLFRNSPQPLDHIFEQCGPLQVLGTLNAAQRPEALDPRMLSMHANLRSKLPKIDCPHDSKITVQIIMFDRPDPMRRMQYLSLTPISLELGDRGAISSSVPPFDNIDKEEEEERKRIGLLVEKLKTHTVAKHARTDKELALAPIIHQINCSAELDGVMQSNIGLVGVRQKRALSMSEVVVTSATNLWELGLLQLDKFYNERIWPVVSKLFVVWLMTLRVLAEGLMLFLEWKPLPNSPAALKDVFATAQQIDLRLSQLCFLPSQYITLQRARRHNHAEYIRFFNALWLTINDAIVGFAIGAFLLDGQNADFVAHYLNKMIGTYCVFGLKNMIYWLMAWPAGLKLNNELAAFFGDMFLWVIDSWEANCLSILQPVLPSLLRLIGACSFAGATLPISMVSDLLSLLTLHIHCFYIASARLFHWQLSIIASLFHLFRGKKRNILRNRIDSQDYDLDQLLLGTILFTLLFFLIPTVAVFYIAFAGARMGIIALKASLDTWLACLNHFPLFALMLRVKDSRRLPGGIRFELQQESPSHLLFWRKADQNAFPGGVPAPISYVKLKSVPLPLSQIFSQYAQLGHRLRKHYLSSRVFLCLLSGQFVPPIHRKNLYSMQYSMLPVQRVGIGELWRLLTEEAPDTGGGAGDQAVLGLHAASGMGLGNGGLNGSAPGGGGGKKGTGANGTGYQGRSRAHHQRNASRR